MNQGIKTPDNLPAKTQDPWHLVSITVDVAEIRRQMDAVDAKRIAAATPAAGFSLADTQISAREIPLWLQL